MPALTVENAIHAELVAASGLTGDRIIYEYQNRDAIGVRAFMTLHFERGREISPAHPEETIRDNPDAPVPTPGEDGSGDELLIGTLAEEEFTCRVTCYGEAVSGGVSAYDLLKQTTRKLAFQSASVRLSTAANVVFVEVIGDVRHVPQINETEYESQAVADLRFRMTSAVEETTTFIEEATFEGTFTGTNTDE